MLSLRIIISVGSSIFFIHKLSVFNSFSLQTNFVFLCFCFSLSANICKRQTAYESALRCGLLLTESGSSGQPPWGGCWTQPATGVEDVNLMLSSAVNYILTLYFECNSGLTFLLFSSTWAFWSCWGRWIWWPVTYHTGSIVRMWRFTLMHVNGKCIWRLWSWLITFVIKFAEAFCLVICVVIVGGDMWSQAFWRSMSSPAFTCGRGNTSVAIGNLWKSTERSIRAKSPVKSLQRVCWRSLRWVSIKHAW